MSLEEWLAHPFVLLVVGAGLTAGTGSLITRLWENRKNILQVKVQLFEDISDFIGDVMAYSAKMETIHTNKTGLSENDANDITPLLERIIKMGSKIRARLLAYSSSSADLWFNYYSMLLLYLEITTDIFQEMTPTSRQNLKTMLDYFGSAKFTEETLAKLEHGYDQDTWGEIGNLLNQKGTYVMIKIKDATFTIN